MKKIFLGVLLLVLSIVCYFIYQFTKSKGNENSGTKLEALASKKHSIAFNASVIAAMNAYFNTKAAFVDADTANIKLNCAKFLKLIDSIPLNELKADTVALLETAKGNIMDIKSNAESLLHQTNITEMRKDFGMVSEMMYPSFFKAINYEGPKIYWQNCPMAFGEGKEANWLSNTKEILNPYLGKNHPEFKATMLNCGEVKDSIQ